MFGRKKLFALLLLLIMGSLPCCITKHDEIFQKQLFDLNWKFGLGDFKTANETGFDDFQWRNIDLPHDWSTDPVLTESFKNAESKEKTIKTGWYRKSFEIPENWVGKKIVIEFEGITSKNEIFINGVSVKHSEIGEQHTKADLTANLNPKGKNMIAIRIDIPNESNLTKATETGIFRHVWLVISNGGMNP